MAAALQLQARGALACAAPALNRAVTAVPLSACQLGTFAELCPRFADAAGQPVPFCRLARAGPCTLSWVLAERSCGWCDRRLTRGAALPAIAAPARAWRTATTATACCAERAPQNWRDWSGSTATGMSRTTVTIPNTRRASEKS